MQSNKKQDRLLKKIIIDSNILAGKPIIKGTRLSVQFILGLLSAGSSIPEILDEYKDLTKDDIEACYVFR